MSKYDIAVMVDIETFSTAKTAAIASIGACMFDDKGILNTFYANIDPRSCKQYDLHFSQETLDWWKKQKSEAWEVLKNNRKTLPEVLTEFKIWYGNKSVPTWANGPDFDLVITENAYNAVGLEFPWKYWDYRCFRTFKALFKSVTKFDNVKHNSLDDAMYQTKYILDVLNRK